MGSLSKIARERIFRVQADRDSESIVQGNTQGTALRLLHGTLGREPSYLNSSSSGAGLTLTCQQYSNLPQRVVYTQLKCIVFPRTAPPSGGGEVGRHMAGKKGRRRVTAHPTPIPDEAGA